MLYWLLYEVLQHYWKPLNVFRYITVRTAYASLTALFLSLVLGPWVIGKLRELQIGQYIREEGPERHQAKAGTPTMGGVLIVVSTLAVAAELPCTKVDDKGCTMAKGADGKEIAVMGAGMKMGEKMGYPLKAGQL